jgi:hypothetical protein
MPFRPPEQPGPSHEIFGPENELNGEGPSNAVLGPEDELNGDDIQMLQEFFPNMYQQPPPVNNFCKFILYLFYIVLNIEKKTFHMKFFHF